MGGWIGIDLDGTLATYNGWVGPDHIGEPVPKMKEFVLDLVAKGKEIKIFTARASRPEEIPGIQAWLIKNGMPAFEVTNIKDFAMIDLYDDRCWRVEKNTGRIIGG